MIMAGAMEAFVHYRSLYVRYIRVLRKLARCYDGMKHPQKRILVKDALEWAMARVVQVRGCGACWACRGCGAEWCVLFGAARR